MEGGGKRGGGMKEVGWGEGGRDTGIMARVEQVTMMRVAKIEGVSVGEGTWMEGETRQGLRFVKGAG